MAKSRINQKMGALGVDLPECPVCFETMSAPIYQCQSGHSLCSSCTSNLCPPLCPICRQPMTQMRNLTLEDIIAKALVVCPNKSNGCVYTMMSQEVNEHLKECIFREMTCPLGVVFGKCSWNGNIKELLQHFNDRHPENCNINMDTDVELDKISITEDDRRVYLVVLGKMLFILTVKIDTIQKMAYWLIQHIGSKKIARQHVYEIHITSRQDNKRKVSFHEYCFNDAVQADEIVRQGKCGIVPLTMLSHFIRDKKILFQFTIKRIPANPNQKNDKADKNNASRSASKGPNAPGPRGQAPHGQRQKSPGPINVSNNNQNNSRGQRRQNKNHPLNFK